MGQWMRQYTQSNRFWWHIFTAIKRKNHIWKRYEKFDNIIRRKIDDGRILTKTGKVRMI